MATEAKYKIYNGSSWEEVTFPPSSHTHSEYLPLTGGTIDELTVTGNVIVYGNFSPDYFSCDTKANFNGEANFSGPAKFTEDTEFAGYTTFTGAADVDTMYVTGEISFGDGDNVLIDTDGVRISNEYGAAELRSGSGADNNYPHPYLYMNDSSEDYYIHIDPYHIDITTGGSYFEASPEDGYVQLGNDSNAIQFSYSTISKLVGNTWYAYDLPNKSGTFVVVDGNGLIDSVQQINTNELAVNNHLTVTSDNEEPFNPSYTNDIDAYYHSLGIRVYDCDDDVNYDLYFPMKSGTFAVIDSDGVLNVSEIITSKAIAAYESLSVGESDEILMDRDGFTVNIESGFTRIGGGFIDVGYQNRLKFTSSNISKTVNSVQYTYDLPNKSGTFALLSDISSGGKDTSVNEIKQLFSEGQGSNGLSTNYTFSKVTNTTKTRQRGIAYGNGYFVAIAASGKVEYSTDNGQTWTAVTPFTTGTLTGIAYGNGIFIVVDYDNKKIWSTDIPTNEWKNIYTFENSSLEGCRYVNNEFVVVGTSGTIAKSIDATSWEVVHTGDVTYYDVAYGNGKYVVVGGSGRTLYSINGKIWYEGTTIHTTDIRTVTYANGLFVAGTSAGRIDWSSDGINWTQSNNPSSLTIGWIRGFAYGDNRLYAAMYASNGQGEIWISEDKGKTWEVALTLSGTTRLWCICYGNDTFITAGESGILYKLNLGITWQETRPDANYIYYKTIITQNDGSNIQSDVYLEKNQSGGGSFNGGEIDGNLSVTGDLGASTYFWLGDNDELMFDPLNGEYSISYNDLGNFRLNNLNLVFDSSNTGIMFDSAGDAGIGTNDNDRLAILCGNDRTIAVAASVQDFQTSLYYNYTFPEKDGTFALEPTTTTLFNTQTGIYTSTLAANNVKTVTTTLSGVTCSAGDRIKVYYTGGSSYPTCQSGVIEFELMTAGSAIVGRGNFTSTLGGQALIIGAEFIKDSSSTRLISSVYTLNASSNAAKSYVYLTKVEKIS